MPLTDASAEESIAEPMIQLIDFANIFHGVSTDMKIRPLHDRVIVKRLEEERKSAGGIVIPDTAAEKPSQGEVVFAGPGKTDDNGKLIALGVKVGDKILFGKYSGQEFKMDGQDYLHMREDDIIGIVA
jgi:chaperonin GroES